jgi:hypothetical protein
MKIMYLYVKRLPNGLMYLGKTTNKNPYKYKGSGVRWLKEINDYGYIDSNIETWILHITSDYEDLKTMGIYYSKLFNVVNNNNWANLKEEEGDGGETIKRGSIIVNNGYKEKAITINEVQTYIELGWIRGQLHSHIENIKKSKVKNNSNKIGAKNMVVTRKANNSFISGAKKAIETKKKLGTFDLSILKMIETKVKNGTGISGAIKAAKTKKDKGIPNGMKGKTHSEVTIEKLKKPKTEEHKQKLRKPKPKIECEYCKKMVDNGNIKRWHGKDKCLPKS